MVTSSGFTGDPVLQQQQQQQESAPPLPHSSGSDMNEATVRTGTPKGIMRKSIGSNKSSSSGDFSASQSSFANGTSNNENDLKKLDNTTSSGSGGGQTSVNGSNMLFNSTNQVFQFLKDETISVMYSRRLVYFVILSAAAVLATLTYLYLADDQDDSFNSQYDALAIRFTNLVHAESKKVLDSFSIISREFTSFAIEDNATWPYFVSPFFERHTEISRKMTKTVAQSLVPLIRKEQRAAWEYFSVRNQDWIEESIAITGESYMCGLGPCVQGNSTIDPLTLPYVYPTIKQVIMDGNGPGSITNQTDTVDWNFGPSFDFAYAPFWQHTPAHRGFVNIDALSLPEVQLSLRSVFYYDEAVFSEVLLFPNGDNLAPYTNIVQPVYSKFPNRSSTKGDKRDIVAIILSLLPWNKFFSGILRSNSLSGLTLVLHDPLQRQFTFRVDGSELTYEGEGDLHESKYDHKARSAALVFRESGNLTETDYSFTLYPSSEMESQFENNEPIYIALGIVGIFLFAALNFTIYNNFVQNRQNKVMAALTATSKVIASIFPANVLDRLMKEAEDEAQKESKLSAGKLALSRMTQKSKLRTFLDDANADTAGKNQKTSHDTHIIFKTKPIADLYTSATIMYADIVGFTAWSSVREPTQVFTLLETVFRQYDELAKRRRVFKVETIGDCYVSVCGVPDPRPDHAVVMARYASDCLQGLSDLSEKLAVELGPDTSELGMRIGMHSGPVTAGILRGEKSRFQLFGDTVHKCQYMEKTSARNRIQISQQTADLLISSGKSAWIEKRLDNVESDVDTYWVIIRGKNTGSKYSGSDCDSEDGRNKMHTLGASTNGEIEDESAAFDIGTIVSKASSATGNGEERASFSTDAAEVKIKRLVEWNSEMLIRLLKQVIAFRKAAEYKPSKKLTDKFRRSSFESSSLTSIDGDKSSSEFQLHNCTVIDEVVEIIDMPEFNSRMKHDQVDATNIELEQAVCDEIKYFVGMIAALYRDNPFHNFEHASHVIMSVSKLLSRIVAPDLGLDETETEDATESGVGYLASTLHDHTYGITSDPMTQFACVFSALIHDVDHPGVPNAQLVKEGDLVARLYNNQSVAEQNSIDIAWRMFMDDNNTNFRTALCPTPNDIVHFRQLVVNSVMATDIVDKKLKELRNKRWDVAFSKNNKESVRDQINRKATIVIEHLIQASDVSHTMQHWHVYCRWNEMFYHEMYRAYKEGRAEKDPSEFWYKGEIGFYDFYIIPLAKKLKDCGVFGVSSDEYLNYAMKNRAEWESRGEEVVAKMVEHYRKMYDDVKK